MKDWRTTLVAPDATMRRAMEAMEASSARICLVADADDRLLGTLTDGDVRRAILRGQSVDGTVEAIMNREPRCAGPDASPDSLMNTLAARSLHHIPIVDAEGKVVGLVTLDDLVQPREARPNWVVLMAGGLGKRLRPLTEETPKPLLRVGGKPLLETILEGFVGRNFRRFYLSVNYKAEMVKAHFGDGSAWNAEIRYLHESQPLGTAGPLGLIDEVPDDPLVVMNADLLTTVNIDALLAYHAEQGCEATMCVGEYDFRVPFGVVDIDGTRITQISEKPVRSVLVNAGVYVLEPGVLGRVPRDAHLDMPDLFQMVMDGGGQAAVFPISEFWLDIGRPDDLDRAQGHAAALFGGGDDEA